MPDKGLMSPVAGPMSPVAGHMGQLQVSPVAGHMVSCGPMSQVAPMAAHPVLNL